MGLRPLSLPRPYGLLLISVKPADDITRSFRGATHLTARDGARPCDAHPLSAILPYRPMRPMASREPDRVIAPSGVTCVLAKEGLTVVDAIPGTITIANDVLADIAGFVALECYGVVGMASPSLRDGVAQLLSRDKLRKGVVITNIDDSLVRVDLYIVVEHGTNLTEVSRNLVDRVKYALTHDADVSVADVEVHVQGHQGAQMNAAEPDRQPRSSSCFSHLVRQPRRSKNARKRSTA